LDDQSIEESGENLSVSAGPRRIQRKRVRGWRLPLDANGLPAVCITRPGVFGNPFDVREHANGSEPLGWYVGIHGRKTGYHLDHSPVSKYYATKPEAVGRAVDMFDNWARGADGYDFAELRERRARLLKELPRLRGRDLACFCAEPQPGQIDLCHGQPLLVLANQPQGVLS
jgi:hypothetical protein